MRDEGRSIEDGLFGVRFAERTPDSLFGRAIQDMEAEEEPPPPPLKRQRRINPAKALHDARFRLAEDDPDLSARRTMTPAQLLIGALLIGALGCAAWKAPALVWQATHLIGAAMFSLVILIRVFAAAASLAPQREAPARWTGEAPIYTILCPLFREARVAEALVASLSELDYPADRLDVKLVLEEDDTETIAAIMRMGLVAPFSLCIVPSSQPQTKPKALNYALTKAQGEFVVVYDAEDAPDPGQLWAALDAFAADPSLACVQAPLRIDNAGARWISSQFAAEYAIQFDAILPLLTRLGLPVPLGGTSNHFRTKVLRDLGAWDPFNVTEDADLGYRLAREGWRTGMIAPPTWEEAPVSIGAWLKQRTRWIKGHMQTWLVLMRTPFRTARQMGLAQFLSIQFVLLAGIVAALAHGPLAIALLAALLSPEALLARADLALAVAGYCTAIYGALAASATARDMGLAGAALTMPLYWPLSTIAAVRALIELIVRPHHWAKTEHGVSYRPRRRKS